MKQLRGVAAVLVGYVLSQGVNGLFVYYWYFGERSVPLAVLAVITVTLFLAVGIATGYLAAWMGGEYGLKAAWVLAVLIAAVTVGNIVADVAAEPLWHKLIVLLLMAPAVVVSARRYLAKYDSPPLGE